MKEAISMQSEALWVRRLEHRTMVAAMASTILAAEVAESNAQA